jgi:hypothetical protein
LSQIQLRQLQNLKQMPEEQMLRLESLEQSLGTHRTASPVEIRPGTQAGSRDPRGTDSRMNEI